MTINTRNKTWQQTVESDNLHCSGNGVIKGTGRDLHKPNVITISEIETVTLQNYISLKEGVQDTPILVPLLDTDFQSKDCTHSCKAAKGKNGLLWSLTEVQAFSFPSLCWKPFTKNYKLWTNLCFCWNFHSCRQKKQTKIKLSTKKFQPHNNE